MSRPKFFYLNPMKFVWKLVLWKVCCLSTSFHFSPKDNTNENIIVFVKTSHSHVTFVLSRPTQSLVSWSALRLWKKWHVETNFAWALMVQAHRVKKSCNIMHVMLGLLSRVFEVAMKNITCTIKKDSFPRCHLHMLLAFYKYFWM